MESIVLEDLDKIRDNDLKMATCTDTPGLLSFSFILDFTIWDTCMVFSC